MFVKVSMIFDTEAPKSEAYQKLLAEDFRKRIYLISYVTAVFMFIAALLNIFLSGHITFFVMDALIASSFAVMGVLIKQRKLMPWIVSGLLLGTFMLLYMMTIFYSGTVHGILFNYTVVPFVAFFIVGIRIGRIYSLMMILMLLVSWAGSSLDWWGIAYGNLAMGMFLLSLCFSIAAAWLFEHIREKAFLQSYQQSLEHDALMNAIDEVYFRVDMQGMIQKIGHGISKFTNYSPDELVGQPMGMFYANPEEKGAYVEALLLYGKVTNYPITIKGKDNQQVHIAMNATLIMDNEGNPQYIEGMFRDVSKEIQLELEQKEHVQQLEQLNIIDNCLTNTDLAMGIDDAVQQLHDIFKAERAFLAPVHNVAEDESKGCCDRVFCSKQDWASPFDLEGILQHEEVKFYVSSMIGQEKALYHVFDEPTIFSENFMKEKEITSYAMILLRTNVDNYWLLGLHNIENKHLTVSKKRLFVEISKRVGATLNQLLLYTDLEAAVVKAEVASKAKGEFVATISHELRTPLHGIIGLLDLMGQDMSMLSDEQRKNLALAQASTQVLRSLIDDVLDLSKIESGNIEIQKQSFYLKQALIDALIPFVMKAREKGIGLYLEMRDVAEMIEGDVQRLRQVLLNLVGNAIKFTSQGYVRIMVSQDEEMLYIHIEDSGIGIDKGRQLDVFKPFSQVHHAAVLGNNLQEKGTGLGTTISQYFITMMGGELVLQSEPGVGSTMIIRLPLQQVGQERISFDLQVEDLIHDLQMTTETQEVSHDSQQASKSWRVLLAEDDPVGRRIAVKQMQRAGFQVEVVTDGLQAYHKFQEQSFDLLLTDIRMPGLTGLQLAEKIRAYEHQRGIPPMLIIGLSAYALEDVRRDALAAGMDDFISKPVDMTVLIDLLESRCEQHG